MSSERSAEYKYTNSEYTNPSVQPGLESQFTAIVRGLEGVRTICDLGCGNGQLAHALGGLGYRVVGVDSSPTGIQFASARSTPGDVRFMRMEIDEHLPSALVEKAGHTFDAVVSSDVIEHLYAPRLLLEAAHGLLRAGGYLVVGTPYHGYLKNLALSILGAWDKHHGVDWEGGHVKFFSVRTLRAMVEKNGFRAEGFRYHGRAPYLWKNMICVARRP